MKNFDNYTTASRHLFTIKLKWLYRSAMVFLAVFAFGAPAALGQSITSFSQYANEPAKEQWINGILNPNNSEYYEGTSTLQRLVFVGIPATMGNTHTFNFKVLATKGGIHAYDFLTSFDQAVADYAAVTGGKDLLTGMTKLQVITSDAIPNPATATIITNLYNSGFNIRATVPTAASHGTTVASGENISVSQAVAAYDALNGATSRGIELYGNSAITSATLTLTGYSSEGQDRYALYQLTWTSASTNMLILMGGHLSIGNIAQFSGMSYGEGRGASSISGGPYHFKLETLNGSSLGNQDNQIQAGAITVYDPSQCSVTGGVDICLGSGNVTFTANGVPPEVNWTYAWTIKTGTGTIVGSSNEKTFTVTPTAAGTLTAQVTISASGYLESMCEQSIMVYATPGAPTTAPVSYCVGETASALTATGTNLLWYMDAVGGTGSATAPTPSTAAAGTTTYYVTQTVNGCESARAALAVTINPLPDAEAGPNKVLTCAATSVMLSGSSATAGVTYMWVASNGGNIVSGANTATPTVNAAGTYTLTVTITATGCKKTDVALVTQDDEKPNISAQGGTLSCEAHSVQLMGSSTTAGVTYYWTGPNGYTSNEQNPTVMVAGNYTLKVTNPANGCYATMKVTVHPQPVIPTTKVTCYTIDFENDHGMIAYTMTEAGKVDIFGRKRNDDGSFEPDNYAGIFDSQAPTGDDDDLYTTDWGNVLIINQDKSGVPNDNQWGGELWLDFSAIGPVTMTSLKALDFDEYEDYSWVILYDGDGKELYKVQIQPLGDNSKQVVDLGNTKGVMKMLVVLDGTGLEFVGSGAIDDIKFCIEEEGQEECYQPEQPTIASTASAYPTPFTDKATIEFSAAETGNYVVNLYNMSGKLVKELKRGAALKGDLTSVDVDARNLPNGIYIAHIISGNSTRSVKLILRR